MDENSLKAWIARNKDNRLYLYFKKPIKYLYADIWDIRFPDENDMIEIESKSFPNIKWEDNEPTQVHIVLPSEDDKHVGRK